MLAAGKAFWTLQVRLSSSPVSRWTSAVVWRAGGDEVSVGGSGKSAVEEKSQRGGLQVDQGDN